MTTTAPLVLLLGTVFWFLAFVLEASTASIRSGQQEQSPPVPTKFIGLNVLRDPVYMPLIGAGTWQYNDDEAYESVCKAFGAGYTFVDTAYGYKNQKGVGRAIQDCWKGNRTDLFVMTKIPGEYNRMMMCFKYIVRKVHNIIINPWKEECRNSCRRTVPETGVCYFVLCKKLTASFVTTAHDT